jgi:hypothetical protein
MSRLRIFSRLGELVAVVVTDSIDVAQALGAFSDAVIFVDPENSLYCLTRLDRKGEMQFVSLIDAYSVAIGLSPPPANSSGCGTQTIITESQIKPSETIAKYICYAALPPQRPT